MVNASVYDFVANSFCYNKLCVLSATQSQLAAQLLERNPGVGHGDHLNPGLNNIVSQAHDECVGAVLQEPVSALLQQLTELVQVPRPHVLHQLEVGRQGLHEMFVIENVPVGDLSQQELHYDSELVGGLLEPDGRVLRRLAHGLQQTALSLSVLQLYGLYPAYVEQVAGTLVVARMLGEASLADQLAGLVEQVVVNVVAQQQVHEHSLSVLVPAEGAGAETRVQEPSQRVQFPLQLVDACVIEVAL